MPHFRTLRDIRFANREDDIRGATLYGVDNEKLGRIDDVIFEHASGLIRYAVVDTGGWLSHRQVLVPAGRVHNYEPEPGAFQVDMVKKHVQRLPEFDRSLLRSADDWRDYERHYREWVTTGDVIHRRDNPNLITPLPEEVPKESTSTSHAVMPRSSQARPLGSLPDTNEIPETRQPDRWSRVQQRLRDESRASSADCPECARERRAA